MELLAIIGAVVLFLALVLLIGYYFGGVSFSFHNEVTGEKTEFKRKEK